MLQAAVDWRKSGQIFAEKRFLYEEKGMLVEIFATEIAAVRRRRFDTHHGQMMPVRPVRLDVRSLPTLQPSLNSPAQCSLAHAGRPVNQDQRATDLGVDGAPEAGIHLLQDRVSDAVLLKVRQALLLRPTQKVKREASNLRHQYSS